MAEFNPTPFKGEATVPHVPEDWFTNLFIGTQVRRGGGGKVAGEFAVAARLTRPPPPRSTPMSRTHAANVAASGGREGARAPGPAVGREGTPDRRRLDPPPPPSTSLLQLAVAVTMFPGRLFGLAPRPNRLNRDHAVACANEAAMSGAARRGRVPTLALNKPRATAASWRSMWAKHLHWKAWTLDRQGGGYTPRV